MTTNRAALALFIFCIGCDRSSPTEPTDLVVHPATTEASALTITPACYPAHFLVTSGEAITVRYQLRHEGAPMGGWYSTQLEAGRPLWIGSPYYRGRVCLTLALPDGSSRSVRTTCDDDAPNPYLREVMP